MAQFAYIDFIESMDEINFKYNIIKKTTNFLLKQYLKLSNEFFSEEILINNLKGLSVKIPIIKSELDNDRNYTEYMIIKTLEQLKNFDIDIIKVYDKYNFNYEDYFRVSLGNNTFKFFIFKIIEEGLKIIKKDLKFAEVLIISDNPKEEKLIFDLIYPNINNLYILGNKDFLDEYEILSQNIFEDCGLNVEIINDENNLIKSADIIINIKNYNEKLIYRFKKGSIFIDCSFNIVNAEELALKRQDMLVVNNLKLIYNKNILSIQDFEIFLYCTNKEYKNFIDESITNNNTSNILKLSKNIDAEIDELGIKNNWYNNEKIYFFLKQSRLIKS